MSAKDKICLFGGVKLALLGLVIFLACSSNDNVAGPTLDRGTYAIADYFPIQFGDRWMYEVVSGDSILEPYVDGDSCLGEPFLDRNENGVYDEGVDRFYINHDDPLNNMDLNFNYRYDGPDDCVPSDTLIPFVDLNNNGVYDSANGQFETGEVFYDVDEDGSRGYSQKLILGLVFDSTEYISPVWCYVRRSVADIEMNGFVMPSPYGYYKDVFSCDTSGLRWYKHGVENVSGHPITIAADTVSVGDSTVYIDTLSYDSYDPSYYYIVTWVSTFLGAENVTVPAGTFRCLKFKSLATGWRYYDDGWGYDMSHFIFVTYQWYGQGVGLVKSEGPNSGQYMALKKIGW